MLDCTEPHVRVLARIWLEALIVISLPAAKEGPRVFSLLSSPYLHTPCVYHRLSAVLHGCMGGALCPQRRAETADAASQTTRTSGTTAAGGHLLRNRPATPARQRFVAAVRRVINLLRLRRRWSAYGKILQQQPRSDLWVGLERRSGVLVRVHFAPTEPQEGATSAEILEWIEYVEAKGRGKGWRPALHRRR